MSEHRLSLVTCSYGPDLERCRTLCESVAEYVDDDIEHLLVVPRRDRSSFAPLAGGRTRLVEVESMLPMWARQVPGQRRWWVTACSLPVRGWILQQVTKLAVADVIDREAIAFVDSDVVFVRPLTEDRAFDGGRVRLYRTPGPPPKPRHVRWYREAARLLDLDEESCFGVDFIAQLVTWKRDAVFDLRERIEQATGRRWYRALCNTLHFSEYILYGLFVEQCIDGEGHFRDELEWCHSSWHHGRLQEEDVPPFLDQVEPQHVAVHIQSNLGIDPDRYLPRVREKAAELRASEAAPQPVASHTTSHASNER